MQDVDVHKVFQVQSFASSSFGAAGMSGMSVIHNPTFNKGSAFTEEERKNFKLHGLVPPNTQTLEEQVHRAYEQYSSRADDLAKNTFMASMKMQNEVLYFRLLQTHLKEMFSIIYTPTEGDAIQNYSRLFRRPEGCFLNINDQDAIEECLSNFGRGEDIDYIVVSDGEEILGIGDQGVGAILISVAKLVITTICAGIHPSRQLPVVLDCGTDNQKLLDDELYLGLRQPRARGKEYDQFVNRFVTTARKLFPKAYIHFEDFGLHNAKRLLDGFRPHMACFNDDIQGTGCVTLAALMAALHVSDVKLQDVRIVIFGSGSAGTGIAQEIAGTIATETHKSKDEAAKQIWCLDKPGLLVKSLGDQLMPAQKPFARSDYEWSDGERDLLSVVKKVKPHALIGTSTKPNAFTEEIIREMAKHVHSPIVFPLSNPTRLHEAQPKDINQWTNGRALIATGSPFPPVDRNGAKYEIAECNNSTCFPGIGLGAVLSRARVLSDKMLVAAAKALAARSPALQDPNKPLLPDVEEVREISIDIAKAVIKTAVEEGHAQEAGIPTNDDDLEEWIRSLSIHFEPQISENVEEEAVDEVAEAEDPVGDAVEAAEAVVHRGGSSRPGSTSSSNRIGGAYYAGGATSTYRAGTRSPLGVTPFLLPVAALAIFPGIWLYGAYAYPYSHRYNYTNETSRQNESLPVVCLCQEYSDCGCDDNNNSTYYQSLFNGTQPVNSSIAKVVNANGTETIYINGTVPNATDSTSSSTSSAPATALLEASGYWVMVALVASMVWAL
ncbi:hypothetical protein CNMCM8812_006120 [Aspergillus fumigatus]|nr:hypothetical protein CNMCM8812_006120 [Aspergillus fumigatus]